ncbi:hypothetical protein ABK040_006277 [Willaertia magna]
MFNNISHYDNIVFLCFDFDKDPIKAIGVLIVKEQEIISKNLIVITEDTPSISTALNVVLTKNLQQALQKLDLILYKTFLIKRKEFCFCTLPCQRNFTAKLQELSQQHQINLANHYFQKEIIPANWISITPTSFPTTTAIEEQQEEEELFFSTALHRNNNLSPTTLRNTVTKFAATISQENLLPLCEKMATQMLNNSEQELNNFTQSQIGSSSPSTLFSDANKENLMSANENLHSSTMFLSNNNKEQEGNTSNNLIQKVSKKLSISSPAFEPPAHVLHQTIKQERVLLSQQDSQLVEEFKTSVVRLRGLPWTSTEDDIIEFFKEFKLAKRPPSLTSLEQTEEEKKTTSPTTPTYASVVLQGTKKENQTTNSNTDNTLDSNNNTLEKPDVLLMLNYYGKSTGEAYVKFENEEELEKAKKVMDKKHLGHRYIEIFKSTEEEMEHSRRVLERNLKNLNQSKILKMRNVPFSATDEEIIQFFNGLEIATMKNSLLKKIYFVVNPLTRKRTGEVFVEFISHEQMIQASKRNKEKIRSRYIELFHSSISELRASQYYLYQQEQQHQYNNRRKENNEDNNEESTFSDFVIKLEGLPSDLDEVKIADWLTGLEIADQGIHLIFDDEYQFTGEAFVEFLTEESVTKALEKDITVLTSADATVKKSDKKEMLQSCGMEEEEEDENNATGSNDADINNDSNEESQNNVLENENDETIIENNGDIAQSQQLYRQYNNNNRKPRRYYPNYYNNSLLFNPYLTVQLPTSEIPLPYYNPYYATILNTAGGYTKPSMPKPFKYKLFEHPERTLKLRGLPFNATENDIKTFFEGYDFEDDSIRFKMDFKKNRQTGICYVRFKTKSEAERAANEKNRCNIANRYIELFTITPKT